MHLRETEKLEQTSMYEPVKVTGSTAERALGPDGLTAEV